MRPHIVLYERIDLNHLAEQFLSLPLGAELVLGCPSADLVVVVGSGVACRAQHRRAPATKRAECDVSLRISHLLTRGLANGNTRHTFVGLVAPALPGLRIRTAAVQQRGGIACSSLVV